MSLNVSVGGYRLTEDYLVSSVHAEERNDHECTLYKLSRRKVYGIFFVSLLFEYSMPLKARLRGEIRGL